MKKLSIIIFSVLLIFSSCQKHEDIKIDTANEQDAGKTKFTKMGEVFFQDSLRTLKKKIDVEIADRDDARHLGLMYRENMKEDEGMFFIFPQEDLQGFYMKNTIISLDIIFVNSKKEIVKIHKRTEPFSEKTMPSMRPAKFVVEVNAGFTDKFGIKEGDFVDWRRN